MTGRVTARCGFATPALVVLLAVTALVVGASARAADPTDSILTYGCDPPLPRAPTNCSLWHTSPVTLRWTLVDPNFVPMPGSDCDTKTVGTDTTGMNVTCVVWDLATTQVSKTATLRVDQTPPAMGTPAPARPPDHTGWWTHPVAWTFSGTDATSGIAGCDTITYSGPDVSAGDVPGKCTDVAGNSATAHASVNYDATAPTVTAITPARTADQSGWWNHSVKWTLSGTDATSGIAGCDTVTYSGPDSATGTVSGDCRDVAGNSKTGTTSIKYDATAPNVSGATPSRAADKNGWWNHAVNMAFTGSDATSGISGCDTVTYSGPDTGTGNVSGNCRDTAGNSANGSVPIKYDATVPNVTNATPDRAADQNGWWNHSVRWAFQGNDATSGLSDCDTVAYSGPDSAAGTVTGSCRDLAGNANSLSKTLKYDGTGPSITGATPARPADKNGWWNHSVTWAFQGTDALSGMAGCDSVAYTGPDSGTGDVSGACHDLAGNSTTGHYPIKFDGTPPTTPTGTPDRPADHNGWWNHPFNVAFGATDATSGVASCATVGYSGPDKASASVGGTCSDNAGNSMTGSRTINYDSTPPTVNAGLPQRAADSNGWWNHPIQFAFSGTDATSDIESCDTPTYSGPDAASGSVTGACRDNAGNSASRQVTGIAYDATPPTITGIGASRPADHAGWWNAPVTVTATGTDARSGIATCAPIVFSGPDNPTASVQAGCRDIAGNSASSSMPIKYDATPPTITSKTTERAPDHGVWFNAPVKVSFAGTDATSGMGSCDAPTYSGPDGANVAVSGDCRDGAGNAKTGSATINYDHTPPVGTTGVPQRPADHNGWWTHPVTVAFTATDATSNIASCDSTTYSGPDNGAVSLSGQCRDNAGNAATGSTGLQYDSTAPQKITATPDRGPDHDGWYNHPVQYVFSGTDATSGIESCDAPTYSGPDAAAASVTGACRNNAGLSASSQVTGIEYDATPPTLTTLPPEVGSNQVVLHWHASADAATTQIIRSPGIGTAAASTVYTGDSESFTDPGVHNDETYAYSINVSDAAGNVASSTVTVTPVGAPQPTPDAAPAPVTQAAPTPGVETPASPIAPKKQSVKLPSLKWRRVKRADYYNLQLFRGNRKLLSAWVKANHFQLRSSWVFHGKRIQLTDARYDWYVWPGFGRRSLRRYGHLITHQKFTFKSEL